MNKLFPLKILTLIYQGRIMTMRIGTPVSEGEYGVVYEYDFSLS